MKGIQNQLQREKIFRVTIYSKDRVSGNVRDGIYAIDIPDFIQDINKYHIAVEEAVLASEPTVGGNNGINRTYLVETSVTIPDSYSTSSKSNTRVMFQMCKTTTITNSIGYYIKPITSSTIGIPLADVSMLRSKQMRILFKLCDDEAHTVATMPDNSAWSMTLLIYPFEQ
jgi:hypothetical protein